MVLRELTLCSLMRSAALNLRFIPRVFYLTFLGRGWPKVKEATARKSIHKVRVLLFVVG